MKNFFYLSALLLSVAFISCNDDEGMEEHMHSDDEYNVEVSIMSPAANSTHAVNEVVHTHVEMAHPDGETIHNVKIQIENAAGDVVMTLVDDHVHEESGMYEFHSMEWTPGEAGEYSLHAETTNHDGDKSAHMHADFTVE